jgi:hypothetical protein
MIDHLHGDLSRLWRRKWSACRSVEAIPGILIDVCTQCSLQRIAQRGSSRSREAILHRRTRRPSAHAMNSRATQVGVRLLRLVLPQPGRVGVTHGRPDKKITITRSCLRACCRQPDVLTVSEPWDMSPGAGDQSELVRPNLKVPLSSLLLIRVSRTLSGGIIKCIEDLLSLGCRIMKGICDEMSCTTTISWVTLSTEDVQSIRLQ